MSLARLPSFSHRISPDRMGAAKHTVGLLGKCLNNAEMKLDKTLTDAFPGADEETITTLLHFHLYETVKDANDRCMFATALAEDSRPFTLGL